MKKCPYCAEQIQEEAIVCRWCGRDIFGSVSAPPGPQSDRFQELHLYPADSTSQGLPRGLAGRTLVVLGGVLLGISPFLPWVHLVLFGDVNLMDLLALAHQPQAYAYVGPAIGVAAVVIALASRTPSDVQAAAISIGILVLAIGGYAFLGLAHEVAQTRGFAQVGIGAWAALAGGVLMIAGGAASQ